MIFFVFTNLYLPWVVKKLLSNQLRYKCHYSIRPSSSTLKVKTWFVTKSIFCLVEKRLTGTFTWYSSRLHAMFAFFPLPQESQFPILPAFLVLHMKQNIKSCWDIPFKMIKIMARLPSLTHPSESTHSLSDYITYR